MGSALSGLIGQAFIALQFAAALTFTKLDDAAVRGAKAFYDFAKENGVFQKWLNDIPPAEESPETGQLVLRESLVEAPPEMQQLFDRFKTQVGEESAGSFSEIIQIIFQAVAWWKAFKGKLPGAGTPAPAG